MINIKDINFRLGQIDDIEDLVRLRTLMQIEVNDFSEKQVSKNYRESVRQYFLSSLPEEKYVTSIAEHKEKIIGAAGVCFYQKPPSISGGTGLVGYVTNVYTEKLYRGKGVGTRMMQELVKLAQDKRADKLHLGATANGMSIYKSVGFEEPRFTNLEIKLS